MSGGVWILLGLVVLAVVILKARGGGSKAPRGNDVMDRYKKQDALVPELMQECARAAKALPIVDEKTSGLFHDPVYDARVDQFGPPCMEVDFDWSTGKCWLAPDKIHEAFESYAEDEASFRLDLSWPRTSCIVAANDHLDVIRCNYSVNEPGVNVMRVSRVAEDRWHVHHFTCGMKQGGMGIAGGNVTILLTSDSGDTDPPIKAVDVARDPTQWTRREEKLRGRWKANRHYLEAVRLCTHKPQGQAQA